MKNKISLVVLISLLAVALVACSAASAAPSAQTTTDGSPLRVVSVAGVGRVMLTPDMATISIGVQTENSDAQQAVSDNNAQTQAVLDTLVGFGIPEEDIQTTNFSVYPRQDYNEQGEPQEVVYVVQNTVMVKVRDLDQVGDVLDATVEAGANNVWGITFDVADRSAAESQALELAVEDARGEAEVLAQAVGGEVGDVQSIGTVVADVYPPMGGGRVMVEAAEAAAVPISPGQLEITANVTVVYELK